jgi:hypothetical protein
MNIELILAFKTYTTVSTILSSLLLFPALDSDISYQLLLTSSWPAYSLKSDLGLVLAPQTFL